MLRSYSHLVFSLAIGTTFLVKQIFLPDSLVWFAATSVIAAAILSIFMLIRTIGLGIGLASLILVYHNTPVPSITLIVMLAFIATLLVTATGLLIAADLSIAKEKTVHEN